MINIIGQVLALQNLINIKKHFHNTYPVLQLRFASISDPGEDVVIVQVNCFCTVLLFSVWFRV